MRSNASRVTCADGDAAPHTRPTVRWPGGVQRVERAGGRNVGAGQARRDRVAERELRPAAAVLERGIIRLRRREGIGLVLEAAYRDDRHRCSCRVRSREVSRYRPSSPCRNSMSACRRIAVTDAFWKWDAVALAAGIRAREISSREAVTACVERMHAVNPQLNAVTCDLSEQALAAADRRRRGRRARGQVRRAARSAARGAGHDQGERRPGRLRDRQRRRGIQGCHRAPPTVPVVANWKKAGAVIIGRTNTPAFSFRLDTVNDFRGRTYSPWSRTHHAGRLERRRVVVGRGGHHAARARQRHRGLGALSRPIARGLPDCGRRSGACRRTTPRARPSASISAQLMSVQGPLARSVRDVRLGFHAMAARDPRDPWWVPVPLAGAPCRRRSASRSSPTPPTWAAPRRRPRWRRR